MPFLLLMVFLNPAVGAVCEDPRDTIIVGGDLHYPPFHFLDAEQNPVGFDIDIIRAVAESACLNVQIRLDNWDATLLALERGDVDVVPMFITEPRQQRFLFSNPVTHRYHVVFGRINSPTINRLEDLAGYEVIVERSGAADEKLTELGFAENLVLLDNEPDTLKMLAAGRHDFALLPESIGRTAIRHNSLDNLRIVSPSLLDLPYALGINKNRPELQGLLNDGLREIKLTGLYDRIYEQWLSIIFREQVIPSYLFQMGVVALLSIVFMMIFIVYRTKSFRDVIYSQGRKLVAEVKARKEYENRAYFLAYHDENTGLPNFNKIRNDLNEAILVASQQQKKLGVMYFNLVEYPLLVQSLGYGLGEQLLQHIATILRAGKGYSSGITSPGYFVAITDPAPTNAEIAYMAGHILNPVEGIHMIGKVSLDLRCQSGLAIYPDDGEDAESLLRRAELAHVYNKNSSANITRYNQLYEPDERNVQLIADLRMALQRDDQLFFLYQPQLDLNTRKLAGAELLIRWKHPEFGLLPPNLFIPLAEKTGLIKELTKYAMSTAMRKLQHELHRYDDMKLSVNVSANDISNDEFASAMLQVLGAASHNLVIEITETAATTDTSHVIQNITSIRNANIGLSVDDYGTGFSSLSYLKLLDPDEIKIDRLFIKDLVHSSYDQTLVRTTIEMAHKLDIRVVAEGVEDAETFQLLRDLGCDVLQGFYISKPLVEAGYENYRTKFQFAY